MKQHITGEQLNEYLELKIQNGDANLNFEKQRKLNKLLGIESERNYPPAYLITIGKMIEILQKYAMANFNIYEEVLYGAWVVKIDLGAKVIAERKEELCDSLWELVKKVL